MIPPLQGLIGRQASFDGRLCFVALQHATVTKPGHTHGLPANRLPMPYLSIENLCVSYDGLRVLDHVSLDVERGEMIALLGSSGCGKTTLLRSIAGFVIPDEGTICVAGKDITR